MHAESTDLDDGFGHWLAGFIDGEGCFCIAANGGGTSFCSLSVALRADDSPGRGSTKPYARWVVQAQGETLKVVALLTRYPLRGKKALDFTTWSEAVAVWCTGKQGSPAAERWPVMDALKLKLQTTRAFVPRQECATHA